MLLRPSQAPRWWHCPLSVNAAAETGALPDEETDAAREGTCAAWVAEKAINGEVESVNDMIGETHENGWQVDVDMVRHTTDYVDLIQSRRGYRAEVGHAKEIAPDITLAGTADAHSFSADGSTIFIDDLKFGYRPVEPMSKQLICYAILAADMFGDNLPENIQLGIYQPRAIHPEGVYRYIAVNPRQIRAWRNELYDVVRIMRDNPTLAVPDEHCRNCTRAVTCNALTQTIYSMWKPLSKRDITVPDGQQLADELTMLDKLDKLLKARKEAVEAEAEIRIASQQFVPGWHMEDKIGKSAWKHDPGTIQALTGIDPYEQKVVTPAELKRRGAGKDLVDSLTYRPRVGRKLSKITENKIERMFSS